MNLKMSAKGGSACGGKNKNKLFKSRGFSWTVVVIYAAFIFFVSSRPTLPKSIEFFPGFDKVAHLIEYAILGWLLLKAFLYAEKYCLINAVSAAVILALLYAFSDELHQAFVPPRQCDFFDYLADSAGIFIPAALFLVSKKHN